MTSKITCLLMLFVLVAKAQPPTIPWIHLMGGADQLDTIHTISAQADVTVSDGLTYSTHAIYQDPQRAAFRLSYPDRERTQGIDGKYLWVHNDTDQREQEAPPFIEEFVLGHQFHAQLLYFDQLHPDVSSPVEDEFEGEVCLSVTGSGRLSPWKVYYEENVLPLALVLMIEGAEPIVTTFGDWRTYHSMTLPFLIKIDDGERQFEYQYSSVEINQGDLEVLRLSYEHLSDEQQLLRLHRLGMDDHYFERIDGLRSVRHDTFTVVNRGEVITMDAAQFDSGMSGIMNSRDHSRYDDLIRPIVKVSEDGTLGWVIVQVKAEGELLDENRHPEGELDFTSAWIELYEKINGDWKMEKLVWHLLSWPGVDKEGKVFGQYAS